MDVLGEALSEALCLRLLCVLCVSQMSSRLVAFVGARAHPKLTMVAMLGVGLHLGD